MWCAQQYERRPFRLYITFECCSSVVLYKSKQVENLNHVNTTPSLFKEINFSLHWEVSMECQKWSRVALFLLYFSLWWSTNLTSLSLLIRCKTKTNPDLVARVFPRFRPFGRFNFVFSLASKGFFPFFW